MEHRESLELLSFYGWWQLVTCFFAFCGLIAIWYHIGRKQKDMGQIWLALSILCWSLSGAVELFYTSDGMTGKQHQAEGWRSIFSLLNSLFILLALPWFRYLPEFLKSIIQSKYWKLIVGLPFLFSLLPTVSKLLNGYAGSLISELDVYYAILTLIILGMVLWESFQRRRLIGLAYLSVICILITFAAQIYKMTDAEVNQILFSAIFKSSLIMIFFALALSWVKDLSEYLKLNSDELAMTLSKNKNENGKWIHTLALNGISNGTRILQLSPTHFALLTTFAERKKNGDGWLEIMPKGEERSGKRYDIKDYNEVKRLTNKMLDQIFGQGNWTKDQHETPFRDAIFERSENRDRKIRLKLHPNNIEL